MTIPVAHEPSTPHPAPDEAGFGSLRSGRGNLPLHAVDVAAHITGLVATVQLTQTFHNPFDIPLEATYIFPLPSRAAVTALRMTAAERTIEGKIAEREQARHEYAAALAEGRRASIAEEERPEVFTMRLGNINPGENVTLSLHLTQPLPSVAGEATFRFPFVVAPRYIPGNPRDGADVGDGTAPDTDAAPDASRISPPVLLPGFPNPVALSMTVTVDPAGLPIRGLRSSLHVVDTTNETAATPGAAAGTTTLQLRPGNRLDRDFVLRFDFTKQEAIATTAHLVPDPQPAQSQQPNHQPTEQATPPSSLGTGTVTCVVSPPHLSDAASNPRDVVVALDRSGSMRGWKLVAAQRAAARIVDSLSEQDTLAVLSFSNDVTAPAELGERLVSATDRNRFQAVSYISTCQARGGTDLLHPLRRAVELLAAQNDPVTEESESTQRAAELIVVTDGQVGNEDQLLHQLAPRSAGVRAHMVGIDQAANAGLLERLSGLTGGHCELVESENQLDEALRRVHHHIGTPMLTGVQLSGSGIQLVPETMTPPAPRDVFPGRPLTIRTRCRGGIETNPGEITVRATTSTGEPWEHTIPVVLSDPAPFAGTQADRALWARAYVRQLEDRYATADSTEELGELEHHIVAVSLWFGVLCRFTAFVALDSRVSTEGAPTHRITQPVELPRGWQPPASPVAESMAAPTAGNAPVVTGGSAGSAERAPQPPAYPRTPPGPPEPPHMHDDGTPEMSETAQRQPPARPTGPSPEELFPATPTSRRSRTQRTRSGFVADPNIAQTVATELQNESAQLTELTTAPSAQRLEHLRGLGARLAVQLDRLRGRGIAETQLRPLIALVPRLRTANRPSGLSEPELDQLWRDALQVVQTMAETLSTQQQRRRRPFWKR